MPGPCTALSERQHGKRAGAGAEVEPGGEREPVTICGYESRYDQILETALNEYADVPCSDYYRDGYNLALRMKEYREAHLLFPLAPYKKILNSFVYGI